MKMMRLYDPGQLIVIAMAFILFFLAHAAKGISHALFQETGVLLVSFALIIMAHKNDHAAAILSKLDDVHSMPGSRREEGVDSGKAGR